MGIPLILQAAPGGVVIKIAGGGGILHAFGTAKPTDGTAGYAVGCFFQRFGGGAGTAAYINEGTFASCAFKPLGSIGSLPGALTLGGALTITTGGETITAGDLTLTAGNVIVTAGTLGIGTTAPAATDANVKSAQKVLIAGGVTDGYCAGLHITPEYDAATSLTVTRHNYFDLNGVVLGGAGPAVLTDACIFRFDAAAGTHKAVDSGSTKTSPGTVSAWMKNNVNGTIYFTPMYTSKTS